jgi:hypothetical protein
MRAIIFFGLMLSCFFPAFSWAQRPLNPQEWQTVQVPLPANFSFALPQTPQKNQEDDLQMFNAEVDSLLFLQVHYVDSAEVNRVGFPPEIANMDFADEFVVKLLEMTQGTGTLESTQRFTLASGAQGREVCISYPYTDEHHVSKLGFQFSRVFYYRDKFFVFSIMGEQAQLPQLLIYKDYFFSTIQIAP